MKSSDIQFLKKMIYFCPDFSEQNINDLLNIEIFIDKNGEPDSCVDREESIIYHKPTSILKFLFNISYALLSKITPQEYIDILAVFLMQQCKDYVYHNYENKKILNPVILDIEKVHPVNIIIEDILKPLTGKITKYDVLFTKCNFTDAVLPCSAIGEFQNRYNMSGKSLSRHDFPILVANASIYNKPAIYADLLFNCLLLNFENTKTTNILSNLLLDKDLNNYMNLILKNFESDPVFILSFNSFLHCHANLKPEESQENIQKLSNSESILKISSDGKYTPQVWNQWDQFSMNMGLIEKQLSPMRGSMWPTSTTLKPYENHIKQKIEEKSKKVGKNQLNFEELLEVIRDIYKHNAVEPGKLVEHMLKDNRVWKN